MFLYYYQNQTDQIKRNFLYFTVEEESDDEKEIEGTGEAKETVAAEPETVAEAKASPSKAKKSMSVAKLVDFKFFERVSFTLGGDYAEVKQITLMQMGLIICVKKELVDKVRINASIDIQLEC